VCDLETSRMGAPYIYIYIYGISRLRVKRVLCYNMHVAELSVLCVSSCRRFVRIDLNEVQEQAS